MRARFSWSWIDGIPGDAPAVSAPSGPRGGVDEIGDDVGQYTSLAIDREGHLHIAYHDVTHQQLKYAHGSVEDDGSIRWNVVVLDDGRVDSERERSSGASAAGCDASAAGWDHQAACAGQR